MALGCQRSDICQILPSVAPGSRPRSSSPVVIVLLTRYLLCPPAVLSALGVGCVVGCAFYVGISSSTGTNTSTSISTSISILLCTFSTLSELSSLFTSAFISPTISAILFLSRCPGNRIVGLKNRVDPSSTSHSRYNWAAGDENYGIGQSHRLQNSWFHLCSFAILQYYMLFVGLQIALLQLRAGWKVFSVIEL